jgi:prepilin-type N-terminal cleavage/methylation domain-containing protein/prepilin-type processing-associated H-X9-DG protein
LRRAFTLIECLVAIAIMAVMFALTMPVVFTMRESARRNTCRDHLRTLGLAMYSYQLRYETFPAGVVDNARPVKNLPSGYHHNWVDAILPELDVPLITGRLQQKLSIYAVENLPVRRQRMNVLLCPSDSGPVVSDEKFGSVCLSNYAGCHDSRSVNIDRTNNGVLFLNERLSDADIPDGTCCTLLIGEIRRSPETLGWASGTRSTLRNTGTPPNRTSDGPLSQVYDQATFAEGAWRGIPVPEAEDQAEETSPSRPAAPELPWEFAGQSGGFGSFHSGLTTFLFADGRVKALSDSISQEVYHHLGNRADGISQPVETF